MPHPLKTSNERVILYVLYREILTKESRTIYEHKDKIYKSIRRIFQHRQKHKGKNIPDRHEQCVLGTSSKISVPLVRNQPGESHIQHFKTEGPRPNLEFWH